MSVLTFSSLVEDPQRQQSGFQAPERTLLTLVQRACLHKCKLFLSSLACNWSHLMVESPKVGTVCELDQKHCQQHSMAWGVKPHNMLYSSVQNCVTAVIVAWPALPCFFRLAARTCSPSCCCWAGALVLACASCACRTRTWVAPSYNKLTWINQLSQCKRQGLLSANLPGSFAPADWP